MLTNQKGVKNMETVTKSEKNLGMTYAAATVVFILLYFGARAMLKMDGLESFVKVLIAIAPVPAFAYFIYVNLRIAKASDELEKRVQFEALAFAYPVMMTMIFTLGLLELAIDLPKEDWSYRHVFMFMPIFYFLGLYLARRRYQ
jgi:hypothetical protein